MGALAPGVSRNGSTLAAARARGFRRAQANLLSRTVALPVITAAAVRKAVTLRRRPIDPALARSATVFYSHPNISYVPVPDLAPDQVCLAVAASRTSPVVDDFVTAAHATAEITAECGNYEMWRLGGGRHFRARLSSSIDNSGANTCD